MSPDMIDLLIKSFWETCYMVFASTALPLNRHSAGRNPYRNP